jgi:Fic family protein
MPLPLAASNPHLTDSFVEQQLKVSSNAANRYLGYLTDLGKLIRVNERGQKVFYKLK